MIHVFNPLSSRSRRRWSLAILVCAGIALGSLDAQASDSAQLALRAESSNAQAPSLALSPTFPSPDPNPTGQRGAAVPFITYEAEDVANRLKGTKVVMSGLPSREDSTPEMEASGRSYVQLTQTGDFLEFPVVKAANALVLRHCIPDAPTGGGISASLSLYVNGKFRQKLTLSSRHNWLYGDKGENGQSNDPAKGQAHVFWDEGRFLLAKPIRKGDTLRLQKDGSDSADYYRIDLVDLETAPPALAPPLKGTFLSVADFGAKGDDTADDTKAITDCIAAAKAAHKTVWLPEGTYYQSERFTLDGVALRGAGMWRTAIIGTVEGRGNWFGKVGFQLNGENPQVSDLYLESAAHTWRSDGGKGFTGSANNWRIQNVWVTHTLCGLWYDGSNGIMSGSRVRCTYADAINLNNGARNNLIENNHVRGCGDDGIAILSETELKKPPSFHNVVRFNTVSAIWWGHNGDVAGGSNHVVEDNIFADNAKLGVFTLNLPGGWPMNPLSNSIICRNSFVRGGGNYAWQKRGAVWIYADTVPISNVVFQDNLILNPIFRGIHLTGSQPVNVIFERNVIDSPGENAVQINSDANGSVSFKSNVVRNLPKGTPALVNDAKDKFVVNQSGNSWQK